MKTYQDLLKVIKQPPKDKGTKGTFWAIYFPRKEL